MHCYRCKAAILPGEGIAKFNKPVPGTIYHKACPSGAKPESQAATPQVAPAAPTPAPVMHAGPLDPAALAAIVATVTATLAAQRPLAPPAAVPAPTPEPILPEGEPLAMPAEPEAEPEGEACECCGDATCPGCYTSDCPAFDWLDYSRAEADAAERAAAEAAADAADTRARETLLASRVRTMLTAWNAVGLKSEGSWVADMHDAWNAAEAEALAGASERTAARVVRFARGLHLGLRMRVEAFPDVPAYTAAAAETDATKWRHQRHVTLTQLVDDDEAAVAYAANCSPAPVAAPEAAAEAPEE